MSHLSDPSALFQGAKAVLASKITQAVESCRRAASKPQRRILRVETNIDPIAPVSWLSAQNNGSKVYWADRDKPLEIAGVGESDSLLSGEAATDFEAMFMSLSRKLAGALPSVRYYGGARFNPRGKPDAGWQPFGFFRFVLPQIELINRDGECTLACNVALRPDDPEALRRTLSALDRISPAVREGTAPLPSLCVRRDLPDREGWRRNVELALASLDQGTLQKIVLARRSSLQFSADLDPMGLLKRLKAITPHCFQFCFIPGGGAAFIGASPERLYRRRGQRIWSEALAGTRPRGASPVTDECIGAELLHSEKDLREHEFVVRGIQESLAPLCLYLETDSTVNLLKLSQCQHLASAFHGTLKSGIGDVAILSNLPPTPAVGGYPTEATMEAIRRIEPFDRGWYAGPVGWISPEGAEFAVAIRSGLVEGPNLFLYSGAGIVLGSTSEEEWNEMENKISPFLQAMTRP